MNQNKIRTRVYVEGKWRAIIGTREIRRGKNKGLIEVQIRQPVQTGNTWQMKTRKKIVHKEAIQNIKS